MNLTIEGLIAEVMPYALSTGLFVSTCDIQAFAGFFDDGGAPAFGRGGIPYTPVDGLQGIPCMSAPMSTGSVGAGETKTASEILGTQTRHVLLGGYYPQIPAQNANWRAVIDGVIWDITGAESDSQATQTRLALKIAQI
jgi:hypothetical protein